MSSSSGSLKHVELCNRRLCIQTESQENANDDFNAAEQAVHTLSTDVADDDVMFGVLSQDIFSSQDYCTPAQPSDSLEAESQKDKQCPLSPVKSTTWRNKRCRADDLHECQSDGVWLSNERVPTFREPESASLDNTNPEATVSRKKQYVSKSALALRARVMSPPCFQNPYLAEPVEFINKVQRSVRCCQAYLSATQHDTCGSRYRADFQEMEEIGRGNFSVVYKVLNRIDGCCYAMKRSLRQLCKDSERTKALLEVQALAALGSHNNVVGYHSAWFENDFLYIQMELCDYNLSTALDKGVLRTDTDFLEAMYQVSNALAFIHDHGVVHLDVKPDNIYIHRGRYKLGDFGFATLINGTLKVEEGDARYMSHEILNDDYEHLDKVDMFSLGVTFYELLLRKQSPLSERHIIRDEEIKIPVLPGFSVYFQKLLQDLVSKDPVKRPSAKCVLNNPIFDRIRGLNDS